MLRDSAYIQEKDVAYVNKRRKRRGQRAFEPLYTRADAEKALSQFRGVPYDEACDLFPGVRLTFEDAGHILGSASCHLDIDEEGKSRKLVFTGDVGRDKRPIIRDPVPPKEADILISESTYGDRLHQADEDVRARLLEVVRDAFGRGGKVLIPAFSVGRTQHLVYHLHCLVESGDLPPMPIFVDSPLAANVTEVYRSNPECYDAETREFLAREDDPFGFHRLTFVRDVAASKALVALQSPAIIISASGMCEAGRVIHHLKTIAPDKKSTILIVGYMAPHTLGRRIVEGAQTLRLFGVDHDLAARVEIIGGLSGHADRDELLEHLSHLRNPPERCFLVHGDEKPAESLASALRKNGFPSVEVPGPGDSFEL
jgi:metallo-beta-lactamase family protein